MIAFLAPGQGSEYRGMGLSLAGESRAAAAVLEEASGALGRDLASVLKRGGRELLRADVAQVAVAAVALGAVAALRERGITPALSMGHSAGELAAACAAGHFTTSGALESYVVRTREMAAAAKARRGGMATIDGSPQEVARAVERGRVRGTLMEAGRLAPARWLVSGDEAALRHASASEPLVRLDVAGAWHSPLMEPVVQPLRDALSARLLPSSDSPRATFLSNDDAAPASAEQLISRLCSQLIRPMRFCASLAALAELAPTHVVLLGPSRTLRALLRLNFGLSLPFTLHGTESAGELADCLSQLTRQRT